MKLAAAAYTAGLLDGEGCFRIDRFASSASSIGYQYRPVVEVSMCDPEPLQFIAEASGRKLQKTRKAKSGRPIYTLVWRNGAAAELIRRILPLLHGKREQAALLLHFNDRIAPGRGRSYRPEHFAICEDAYNRCKLLKSYTTFAADCPIPGAS